MPVTPLAQAKALNHAQQMLEARIRYNESLASELQGYTPDEIIDYFYSLHPNYRNYIESAKGDLTLLHRKADQLRDDLLLKSIPEDIDKLKTLLILVKLVKDDECSLLALMNYTQASVAYEEKQEQIAKQFQNARLNTVKKQAKSHAKIETMSSGLSTKDVQQIVKNSVKDSIKAENTYGDRGNISELFIYRAVLRCLYDISTIMEQEFIDKFTELYASHTTNRVGLKLNQNFNKMLSQQLIQGTQVLKNLAALSSIYAELKTQYTAELQLLIKRCTNMPPVLTYPRDFTTQEEQRFLLEVYYTCYGHKDLLKQAQAAIEAATIEENEFKCKQLQTIKDATAKAVQQAKQEKIRATQEQQTKQAEVTQLQKQQQEQRQAKQAAELQAQKEQVATTEAERKQHIALENTKRKQAIAAQRVIREQEKLEFNRALAATHTVKEKDGELQSSFKLSDAAIAANSDALEYLFSAGCKSYSFKDAVTLIGQLKGSVDAGGRHHAVKFGDEIYAYLDDTVKSNFTSGLPRPHKHGETRLYRFELKLLRQSIRSVLPEKWIRELILDPKTKSQPNADMPKPSP